MTLGETTRAAIIEHAEAEFPREACGLVVVVRGKERYWPCRNVSVEPLGNFAMDAHDYAAAEKAGEITALFHSHPNLPPDPSEADRVACEASGLKWIILGVPSLRWAECEPCGYRPPLIGRQHVWGVVDCWALVRDWYAQEWGIDLIDLPRQRGFWTTGTDLLGQNIAAAGFYPLKDGQVFEIGDVILMRTGPSDVPNHVCLYIGDDLILHHAEGRLSSREVYGGWFRKHTVKVVRHANRPVERRTG